MKPFSLKLTLVCCALLMVLSVKAQDYVSEEIISHERITSYQCDHVSVGLGVGMDYGFLGANLNYFFARYLGVFGAVGYAGDGAGTNVGARLRFPTLFGSPRMAINVFGMYGTNTIAVIKGFNS